MTCKIDLFSDGDGTPDKDDVCPFNKLIDKSLFYSS